jgi:hypothetical protein
MSEPAENPPAITPSELAERHTSVLANALRIAQERVNTDPTAANIAAAQAAKRAFDEATNPQLAGPPERIYKNRDEVLQQLHREGYALKKSKLYNDSKRGLLQLRPDKSVTENALRSYIDNPAARLEKPAAITPEESLQAASEKMRYESDLSREMARERKRKNDTAEGLMMPREQVHMELAGRAVALEAGLKHAISIGTPGILEEAAAIADKTERNSFADRRYHELVDEQLNEFANIKTFQAIILEGEEEENESHN